MYFTLQKNWKESLSKLFNESNDELIISSPYISEFGAKFIVDNANKNLFQQGKLKFVTDLSPKNIYQGSTDPNCFKFLFDHFKNFELFHLPQLHAKVYISNIQAIITSGNITAGGLLRNFEYGIRISDKKIVKLIKQDISDFGELGSMFSLPEIDNYCKVSEEIKILFKKKEMSIKKELTQKFNALIAKANDELIFTRIKGDALHATFEKTIFYLLGKYGALETQRLHSHIKEIHPDLCDDNIDRVIDGVRFGKKWKHAVRSTQQHLKKKGLIELIDKKWKLI
jgi:HKD family nuclease